MALGEVGGGAGLGLERLEKQPLVRKSESRKISSVYCPLPFPMFAVDVAPQIPGESAAPGEILRYLPSQEWWK